MAKWNSEDHYTAAISEIFGLLRDVSLKTSVPTLRLDIPLCC